MSRRPAWCQLAALASTLVVTTFASPATAVAGTGQPNWGLQSPATAPVGRSYAGIAYDSARSRTVLFGGGNSTNSTNELNDTWEWDGTRWTQFFPVPAPPASIGPGMAYDSKRGVTVLLDNNSNTWEWNGQTWVERVTGAAPPPRVWTSMVYDSARGVMVLFGGSASGGVVSGDTWTYDGTTWTQQLPASSPSARLGASLAFDSARNVVVLFGGWNGQRFNDTWEWNGLNWAQRTPATSPFPRFFASMVYDATVGATVMFGGDHIEPFLLGPSNDTWLWSGTNWTQDFTFAAPSARAGQAMAYQSALGTDVLIGGSDELNPGTFPTDTWELGSGFVTPAGNPAATFNANLLAFKVNGVGTTSASGRIVVTSSGTGPLLISSIAASGDFAVASSTCPLAPTPLAAGTFCIVQPTFTPTTCATETGSLTLFDNGPGGSQSIPLEGGTLSSTCDGDLLIFLSNDVTVAATSPSGAVVNFTGPGANENFTSQSCTPANGSTFPIGTTAVTCQVTDPDDATPTVSATFHITVTDNDLALTGVPPDINVTTTSPSGATVNYNAPTSVDEDPTLPAVSCSPASGSTFALGTTIVTCSATDADDSPSTVTASFKVTVNDNDLAFSGTPPSGTVNATSPSGALVNYSLPVATDEDPRPPAVSCSPAPGSIFPIGTTTVNCSATDPDDTPSTVTTSFHVTVNDSDLALTSVPANIVMDAFTSAGTAITYTPPTAVDEEGTPVVACDHPSGSTFAIGVTTVTCTATDADDSPSTVTASFTVTIRDTDLSLSGPADITAIATSASGAAVSYPAPVATDEEGTPAATCDHASGSTFPVGVMTRVTCTATDSDDLPSSVSIGFFVTVIPDMNLTASVSPGSATAHDTVTTTASVSNIGAVTRKVSISYTVTFTDASGLTTTVASDKASVTVNPGQATARQFLFAVKNASALGTYVVTVTAVDVTGSVTQSSTFRVS